MIEVMLHGGCNDWLDVRHAIHPRPVVMASLIELLVAAMVASSVALAGQGNEPPERPATNAVAEVGSNPEILKKQTRIVLATNLPPEAEQALLARGAN